MKLLSLSVLLAAPIALAANLEDVSILNAKMEKDHIELKLHVNNGPEKNFFFVDIFKNDADSFEKLSLVLKKEVRGTSFKLSLDIPNFSMSPNGSYYRGESVNMAGTEIWN